MIKEASVLLAKDVFSDKMYLVPDDGKICKTLHDLCGEFAMGDRLRILIIGPDKKTEGGE